jgi:hypothetical protein
VLGKPVIISILPNVESNTKRLDQTLRSQHICKYLASQPIPSPYYHHVVRLSRNSNHRRSIRCFASSIWCLPAIRHHRSIQSDRLPHVSCVCNGHGIERVSRTRYLTAQQLDPTDEADSSLPITESQCSSSKNSTSSNDQSN